MNNNSLLWIPLTSIAILFLSGCSPAGEIPSIDQVERVVFNSRGGDPSWNLPLELEFTKDKAEKVRQFLMRRTTLTSVWKWVGVGKISFSKTSGTKTIVEIYIMDLPFSEKSRIAYRCRTNGKTHGAYYTCGMIEELKQLVGPREGRGEPTPKNVVRETDPNK